MTLIAVFAFCFVFCFAVQWEQNGGNCGVCGDPFQMKEPRPHEAGGEYAKGIISRFYTAGQVCKMLLLLLLLHFRAQCTISSFRWSVLFIIFASLLNVVFFCLHIFASSSGQVLSSVFFFWMTSVGILFHQLHFYSMPANVSFARNFVNQNYSWLFNFTLRF